MELTSDNQQTETRGSNATHGSGALPVMVAKQLDQAIEVVINNNEINDDFVRLIARAAEAAATLRCLAIPELMR